MDDSKAEDDNIDEATIEIALKSNLRDSQVLSTLIAE